MSFEQQLGTISDFVPSPAQHACSGCTAALSPVEAPRPMQLDTNLLFHGPTNPLPGSPASPFSSKQHRWSGIVQQVQDRSARLNVRRRQSTEAAAAAGILQLPPGNQQTAAAACRHGSLQQALDSRAVSAAAGPGPAQSSSRFVQAGRQPAQVSSSIANPPPRFGSLRQRLREVKRGRQHKASSSRASSVLTDSTANDDSSVAGSENSSVVEAKLKMLLLQVATGPERGPALTAAGCDHSSKAAHSDGPGRGVPGPSPSLLNGLLPMRLIGSSRQQQATAVPAGTKGLGVTVRRFKPPSSSSSIALPTTLSHAASSPDFPAAAAHAVAAARVSSLSQLPVSAVPPTAAERSDSSGSGSGSNQPCSNAANAALPSTPATAATAATAATSAVLAAVEAAPGSFLQPPQLPAVQPSQQLGAAMASSIGGNSSYSSRRPSPCVLCGPEAARQPSPLVAVAAAAEPVPSYAATQAAAAAAGVQHQAQATAIDTALGTTAQATHQGWQQQQKHQAVPAPSVQQPSCTSGAADAFNDADIRQLLQRVAACVGPEGASTAAVPAAAAPAAEEQQTAKRHSSGCRPGLAVHAASIDGCIASACRAEPLGRAPLLPPPPPPPPPAAAAEEQHAAPSASAVAGAAAAVAAAAGQQQAGAGPSDARLRPLQWHVSWKADIDVLHCESSDGGSSAPAWHSHHHPSAVVHDAGTAAAATAATDAAAAAAATPSALSAAKLPVSLLAAEPHCDFAAGDTLAAYQSGRAQADMAALLQQHPPTGRSAGLAWIGSSCDGAQPRLALCHQGAAATGSSGACRHDSSTAAAAAAPSAAAAPTAPAVVVRLSSAALALAANLEQQQQQRRQSDGGGEQLARFGSQQQQQGSLVLTEAPCAHQMALQARQHAPAGGSETGFAAAAGPGSVAGTADDGSSCGFSELSAMANPVAYADTLRQRMVAHLGPLPGSTTATAAGVGAADPGLPSSAVNLLERYLDGHQGLKQKAVRLEQNLQQRKQLQQQSEAFELQRRAFSPLGGLPSSRGALLGGSSSSSSSADASSHLNVDELRQDLEVVLRRP